MNDLKNFIVVVEASIEEAPLLCQKIEQLSQVDELFRIMNEGIEKNSDSVLFEVHIDNPICIEGKELESEDIIQRIAHELTDYFVEINDDDSDKVYFKEKGENEFKSK